LYCSSSTLKAAKVSMGVCSGLYPLQHKLVCTVGN
jgi:hypothetical protein